MGPLHWEPLVLATGPPGKSQEPQVLNYSFLPWWHGSRHKEREHKGKRTGMAAFQ